MTTLTPDAPTASIPHPGWCSPQHCISDDVGVTHCSDPTIVQVGGEQLTLRLTQTIYVDDPEPGVVETLVDSTNTAFEAPEAQHEWPAGDLLPLVAALAEMHHKAKLLSAPVLGVAA